MKMGTGLFWGILLIIIGLGLVIKIVFKVDFPVFKIVIAFAFIFIGIKLLMGDNNLFRWDKGDIDALFEEKHIEGLEQNKNEYVAIFGKLTIDITELDSFNTNKPIEISAIFGASEIRIAEKIPLKMKVDVVFGGANLPDGGTGGFGSSVYYSESYDENQPYLYLKTSAIFGGIQVKQK